jgi:hypothetical protein
MAAHGRVADRSGDFSMRAAIFENNHLWSYEAQYGWNYDTWF